MVRISSGFLLFFNGKQFSFYLNHHYFPVLHSNLRFCPVVYCALNEGDFFLRDFVPHKVLLFLCSLLTHASVSCFLRICAAFTRYRYLAPILATPAPAQVATVATISALTSPAILAALAPAQVATLKCFMLSERAKLATCAPAQVATVSTTIARPSRSLATCAPAQVATAHIKLQLFTIFVRKRPPGLLWAGSLPFRGTLASVARRLCPGTSRSQAAKSAQIVRTYRN